MSNGKGSSPRGQSPEERKRFDEGWDRIFGKKPKRRPPKNNKPRGV